MATTKFYDTHITHTCGHTQHHMRLSQKSVSDRKIIAKLTEEPCFQCKYGVQQKEVK